MVSIPGCSYQQPRGRRSWLKCNKIRKESNAVSELTVDGLDVLTTLSMRAPEARHMYFRRGVCRYQYALRVAKSMTSSRVAFGWASELPLPPRPDPCVFVMSVALLAAVYEDELQASAACEKSR